MEVPGETARTLGLSAATVGELARAADAQALSPARRPLAAAAYAARLPASPFSECTRSDRVGQSRFRLARPLDLGHGFRAGSLKPPSKSAARLASPMQRSDRRSRSQTALSALTSSAALHAFKSAVKGTDRRHRQHSAFREVRRRHGPAGHGTDRKFSLNPDGHLSTVTLWRRRAVSNLTHQFLRRARRLSRFE